MFRCFSEQGASPHTRPQATTSDRACASMPEPEQVCLASVTPCGTADGVARNEAADEVSWDDCRSSQGDAPQCADLAEIHDARRHATGTMSLQVRYACGCPVDDITSLRSVEGRLFVARMQRHGPAYCAGVRPGDELVLITAGESPPRPADGGPRALVGILPPALLFFTGFVGKSPAELKLEKGGESQRDQWEGILSTSEAFGVSTFDLCEEVVFNFGDAPLFLTLQEPSSDGLVAGGTPMVTDLARKADMATNTIKPTTKVGDFFPARTCMQLDFGVDAAPSSSTDNSNELLCELKSKEAKRVLERAMVELSVPGPPCMYRNAMSPELVVRPALLATPEDTIVSVAARGRTHDPANELGDNSTEHSKPLLAMSMLPWGAGIGGSSERVTRGASAYRPVPGWEAPEGGRVRGGRAEVGGKYASPRYLARIVPRSPEPPRMYRNAMSPEPVVRPALPATPDDTIMSFDARGCTHDLTKESDDDSTEHSKPMLSMSMRGGGIGSSGGRVALGASAHRPVPCLEAAEGSSGRGGRAKYLSPRDLARSVPRRPLSPPGGGQTRPGTEQESGASRGASRAAVLSHAAFQAVEATGQHIGTRPAGPSHSQASPVLQYKATHCPPKPQSGCATGAMGATRDGRRDRRILIQPRHAPGEDGDSDDVG